MKIEVIMPKMGESVTEGTIIKWHKKPGDPVKKDEVLFEISTDKVDTEIPCQADGVITEQLFNEGDTVDVGKIVAVIDTVLFSSETQIEKMQTEVAVSKKSDTLQDVVSPSTDKTTPVDVPMPKMGESVMEGTVIKWHKKPGDFVKKDELLFDISTDKVDTEVPSPAQGTLTEILVKEQETVPVGHIVAKIASSYRGEVPVIENQNLAMHDMIAAAAVSANVAETEERIKNIAGESDRFYSPLVLNIARKENISFSELERIKGTGLNGRVTKNDILKFLDNRTSVSVETVSGHKAQIADTSLSGSDIQRIPMDNIRSKIMKHMVNSRDTSVHVTAMVEVDMVKIHNYLQKNKDHLLKNEGIKLTYLSFIAHAAVRTLKEYPLINSAIDSNSTSILQKRFVNLGIAVALESNRLIVPNIKNAHEKNLFGLSRSIQDIAEKSRTKKLTPDDIKGGTFTITNYGVFGTLFGTPIINQPEVAILGVGAVVKRPVVIEVESTDTIAIRPMMYLTLSHDHRLVDGMLGGLFLKSLKDKLENFNEKFTA